MAARSRPLAEAREANRSSSGRAGVAARLGYVARPQARHSGLSSTLLASALGAERDLVETSDLSVSEQAGRVVSRKTGDQGAYPVSQVYREVGRGGAHQLAYVLDRGLALEASRLLVLAHPLKPTEPTTYGTPACTGMSCATWSRRAWAFTDTWDESPRIQMRLYTAAPGSSFS